MELLQKLERGLAELFEKKIPLKLPERQRSALAKVLWIIALVLGIIQLGAAIDLWSLGHYVDEVLYGQSITVPYLGFFYYVSVVVVALEGILLLLAASGLMNHKKVGGWNLVYYALVLNFAYGIFRTFSNVSGGISALIWVTLGSLAWAFFLFQVRSYFVSSKPSHSHHQ